MTIDDTFDSDPVSVEFKPIRRTAVTNDAIETIKQLIVSGELKARQRLPAERELAAQLRVSRPSLREAIRALIALNILESRHGEGTFVSSLEPELLAEPIDFILRVNTDALVALFEARRALETAIVGLAAGRVTDADLEEFDSCVTLGRDKLEDTEAFIAYDIEFHRRLQVAARSPILSSLLSSVTTLGEASRHRTAQSLDVRQQALTDHLTIVETLRARDPQAAQTAMAEHLEHVANALSSDEDPQ